MSEVIKRQRPDERERDTLLSELSDQTMTAEKQAAILEWAREIRQGIDDDDVSYEAKRQLLDWLEVETKIEYRAGVRGLYMQCALGFGENWQAIAEAVSSAAIVSDSPAHTHPARARR